MPENIIKIQSKNNSFYMCLAAIIIFNIAVYLNYILKLPGYIADDYYLFYLVDKFPSHPISFNIYDNCLLFIRPLGYFLIWLDYNVLHLSSLLIKTESLLLYLIFIAAVYYFIYALLSYLKISINIYIITLSLLAFSLHPVCMWWIVWISQQNELLMMLFYILSLCSIVKYLATNKKAYLFLYFAMYVLSILSKQSSLHLPLLILLIIVLYRKEILSVRLKKLWIFSIACSLIMAAFFIVTLIIYSPVANITVNSILGKPFNIIGSSLIALFPFKSDFVYSYFIQNKSTGFAVLAVILFTGIYFYYKNKSGRKTFFTVIAILLLSFFPVVFSESNLRTLSIQVLIIYVFISLFLSKYLLKNLTGKLVSISILLILMFVNASSAFESFNHEISLNKFRTSYLTKLKTFSGKSGRILILAAPYNFMIPYENNYFSTGRFGKSDIESTPVGYSIYFKTLSNEELNDPKDTLISLSMNNGTYIADSKQGYIGYFINPDNEKISDFKIIDTKVSNLRGYNQVSFTISDKYKDYTKIYYNGIDWVEIK